jgi:hypothetical protein
MRKADGTSAKGLHLNICDRLLCLRVLSPRWLREMRSREQSDAAGQDNAARHGLRAAGLAGLRCCA